MTQKAYLPSASYIQYKFYLQISLERSNIEKTVWVLSKQEKSNLTLLFGKSDFFVFDIDLHFISFAEGPLQEFISQGIFHVR